MISKEKWSKEELNMQREEIHKDYKEGKLSEEQFKDLMNDCLILESLMNKSIEKEKTSKLNEEYNNKIEIPMINRKDVNFQSNDEEINIGYAEGFLSDERPYRLECWSTYGITIITIFISVLGIENYDKTQVLDYLEKEGLFKRISGDETREVVIISNDNNKFYSVNINIALEDEYYAESNIQLTPFEKEEKPMGNIYQELEKKTGIKYQLISREESIQEVLKRTGMTMEQYKQQEKDYNF